MAEAKKIKNRRKGPDAVIHAIKIFSGFAWFISLAIFITFTMAKPRFDGMTLGGSSVGGVDKTALQIGFYLMIMQALLCAVGIFVSMSRMKRKTDRMSLSLVAFEALAIMSILGYIFVK